MSDNGLINDKNYFSLFNLPLALPVDQQKLTINYQQLQRFYHPDNFVTHSDSEKLIKIKQSADINLAYKTLKDPVNSVEHLLALKGVKINAEQITTDQAFLLEQFALREQLDKIEKLVNNDEKYNNLAQFSARVSKIWQDTYEQLLTFIQETNWLSAVIFTDKLKFLNKLKQSIEKIEDQQFEI